MGAVRQRNEPRVQTFILGRRSNQEPGDEATMKRTSHWLLGAFGAAALLIVACGGSESPEVAATATSTALAARETPSAAPAQPAVVAAAEPVATVDPRPDGLTGAPVPPPTAQSDAFDVDRARLRAGSFPALDYPQVVAAADADWMEDDFLVLGAVQNGESRAYPLFMMTFHHVANDELGGEPYLVTF